MLELLLVLSLSMILLFSVLTSYHQWIIKNQLTALINTTMNALEYARETAVTLHTTTLFCPKNVDDWQSGQLVVDASNQHILRALPSISKIYYFVWRSALGTSSDLRFQSDGFTHGQQGSFLICNRIKSGLSARIVLLRTGRMRAEMGRVAECDAGL